MFQKCWQPQFWKIRPSCILIRSLDLKRTQMLELSRMYNFCFIRNTELSGLIKGSGLESEGAKNQQKDMSKWAGFIVLPWSPVPLQALAPQSHRKLCAPPSKCRPSLHDRTEADSPGRPECPALRLWPPLPSSSCRLQGAAFAAPGENRPNSMHQTRALYPPRSRGPALGMPIFGSHSLCLGGFPNTSLLLNACSLDPRWLLRENSFVTSWKSGFTGEVGPLLASLTAPVTMRRGVEGPSHCVVSEAPWWQAFPQSLSFLKLCALPSGPGQS